MSDGELSGTRRGLKYNCEQIEKHDDNGGTSKITDLFKIKEIVALNLSDAAAKILQDNCVIYIESQKETNVLEHAYD